MARRVKSPEQELVDITFSIAIAINNTRDFFKDKNDEEVAEWVADQLRKCGFDTHPIGLSWGVLK